MCDYSLLSINNRLAAEGEELTVHRFQTASIGLASPSDPVTAVCVPPGAELFLQDIPERLQTSLGVGPCERVAFFERTMEPHEYRDAIRFNNQQELLLQRLTEGQRVTVLSLTRAEPREDKHELVAECAKVQQR